MIQTLLSLALSTLAFQLHPLMATPPMVVPGGPGSFDFMNIDAKDRLVFACHPGTESFAVVDLATNKVHTVKLGLKVNGIDADSASQQIFASGPGQTLEQVSMKTWKQSASLKLSGPGDSVVFDTEHKTVYVDNDDGTSLWFIDPKTMKIRETVAIKEAPEVMVLDSGRGKIFQNIKTTNSLQVIDIESHSVTAEYPLGELTGPHGLAEDHATGKLFSVGKNGKLVVLSADSGKILQTLDVVKGSDQIAYDAKLRRLYIPGSGQLQVVHAGATRAEIIGSVDLPKGCHSVVVDPKTHDVWVAYSDAANSYVMKYAVP